MIPLLLLTATSDSMAKLKDGLELSLAERAMGLVGVATMLFLAWAISYDRKHIRWRLVGTGLLLQAAFGFLVLKTTPGRFVFEKVGAVVAGLLGFVSSGAGFVFGNLIGRNVPVGVPDAAGNLADQGAGLVAQTGGLFAFTVLPTIIFFSSFMSVLYYLGWMQAVVKSIAWVMQRTLGTSGAETLCASGNIFLGQTEAPLLIKPFVPRLTPSELIAVMITGFSTIAVGVMAAYVAMLQDSFPNIAGHLLAASVMNATAGLMLAKIVCPETGVPETKDSLHVEVDRSESGVLEAAANGASLGLQLALNVGAMLIAFIALIAMIDFGLTWVGNLFGYPGLNLQALFGWILMPIALAMGVPFQDASYVGSLIGLKATLNEFVAYLQLAKDLGQGAVVLQPRSAAILAYALLGFANFSSIAIQIGGIGGLAPARRGEIARFGLRAMVAGHLAAFLSASLAGMLL